MECCEEFGAGDHINWTTGPLPNCQCKWTISTGPLDHSRTVSASGPYQLHHWTTPELSVQVGHINWTTGPLPNCQCKWTISTGPLPNCQCKWTISTGQLPNCQCKWTISTGPLPNSQYKRTMTSGPLGHSRAGSTHHISSTSLHKHRTVHL